MVDVVDISQYRRNGLDSVPQPEIMFKFFRSEELLCRGSEIGLSGQGNTRIVLVDLCMAFILVRTVPATFSVE